jgi:hypothetical protein
MEGKVNNKKEKVNTERLRERRKRNRKNNTDG